ncbi:hypothetical protein HanIR_Chr12g0571701 [Helianthus annuus]|nr:hypothetical protein HanIR_Chr12g0571701 [Helianthus annuus]
MSFYFGFKISMWDFPNFPLVLITGECRGSRMKIEHRARTEHTLNKASATLFCRYSKRRFKSHYVYHLNCKSF